MLGIGPRPRGQPLEDLPSPLPHGGRHPRRVELFAEPVETIGGVDGRRAEKRAHLRRRDAVADERRVAGLQAQRHLAADRLQTAAELTDPPLVRVVANNATTGPAGEPHRRGRQPGGPVLRRDEVGLGDGDLLGLGVAGQVDDLEPVP